MAPSAQLVLWVPEQGCPVLPRHGRAVVTHLGRCGGVTATSLDRPAMAPTAGLGDWRAGQVEAELNAAINCVPTGLLAGCRRVIQAGGKRLRPELVVRCAEIGPLGAAGAVDAAVAVELLHSASLVHDDLLDDSGTRRGVAAIHRREGMSSAVLAGDALIALSWRSIAACGPESAGDLGGALLAMCDGQSSEDELRFRHDADLTDVLIVAELKTGALLEAACRIGARLGGCSDQQVNALGVFGRQLGIELQILDDVLDVASDDRTLGKPTGGDFRSGVVTLPTVFGLAAEDHPAGRLSDLFVAGVSTSGARDARTVVLESGAVARAVLVARAHAHQAARAAASAGATDLVALPEQYLQRQLGKVAPDCRGFIISPSRATSPQQQRQSRQSNGWESERAV